METGDGLIMRDTPTHDHECPTWYRETGFLVSDLHKLRSGRTFPSCRVIPVSTRQVFSFTSWPGETTGRKCFSKLATCIAFLTAPGTVRERYRF